MNNTIARIHPAIYANSQPRKSAAPVTYSRYPLAWQKLSLGDERADIGEILLRFALGLVVVSTMAVGAFL